VDTSRDFHLRVMEDGEFQRGEIGIQWLEQRLPSLLSVRPPESGERAAMIAATLLAERDRALRSRPAVNGSAPGQSGATDGWRAAARREGIGRECE
jgi:acetyl-CoA carboxylase biotin carboxylase subunit